MKRTPMEDVVGFLSFSGVHRDRLNAIEKFKQREWKRVLPWLVDAGLAFYFLQRLKDANASDVVPPPVLSRLERNFASNQLRVDAMSRRFDAINHRFNEAGVHYAVIKGFSLVPQFCPFAPLRYQGDFDYLVDDESLTAACRVLIEAGYDPKHSPSSKESIFVIPGGKPSRSDEQYSPQAPHAVELHTDILDGKMHRLLPMPSLFSVAQARRCHWNGFTFPALGDEDAFLLQVLHACHHFFTKWIRMSCLFEIAYFLNRQASDAELWSGIEQRAGDSTVLREFVVVVTELAAQLFAAPVPPLVQVWGAKIRTGPRIWIEHYARTWAFCRQPVYQLALFPSAVLVRFLHQQFKSEACAETLEQNQAPPSRSLRIASSIKSNASLFLGADWRKRQFLVSRGIFYVLSGMRYVCEIPRWRWRNRARVRAASAFLNG